MDARMQTDDPLVILYVQCGGEVEAKQIASRLLDERLIACANINASRSLYRWQAEIAGEHEQVLVCKALASRAESAAGRARQLHSYEVPCVLTLDHAHANDEFYRRVCAEVAELEQADAGQS